MINRKETFTTHELAEYCDVSPRTIVQWIREGKIKAYQTPGRHSRVKREDFLTFLWKYNMPIPQILRFGNERKRILIVDDDQAMTHSIRRLLLRENRYDIDVGYNGFEAGQLFIAHRPDLVILDLRMPRVNGRQLCKAIRHNPDNKVTSILMISGILDEEGRIAREAGADDFLIKPFHNRDLLSKVRHLLGLGSRNETGTDNRG